MSGSARPGRPAWVEVDLAAIRGNVRAARAALAPGARLMAVVKADAYGHGALAVARASLAAGADWLGVAILPEALALREAGISAPILVLGWTPPEEAPLAARHAVSLTVASRSDVAGFARALRGERRRLRVHLKVDTGMSRLGVPAGEEGLAAAEELSASPELDWEGTFTHFARADEVDPGPTLRQLERFRAFLSRLGAAGLSPGIVHAANTAAIFRFPEAHLDMARLGIGLYGYPPAPDGLPPGPARALKPALSVKARLALVKRVPAGTAVSYGGTYVAPEPEWLGTVPLGYADGYLRCFGNRAEVLVAGRRRPVRGRVCMDQFVVGLGPAAGAPVPPAREGDEVVVLGRQGPDAIDANDLAELAGTIPYEILAGWSPRLPRVYVGGDGAAAG